MNTNFVETIKRIVTKQGEAAKAPAAPRAKNNTKRKAMIAAAAAVVVFVATVIGVQTTRAAEAARAAEEEARRMEMVRAAEAAGLVYIPGGTYTTISPGTKFLHLLFRPDGTQDTNLLSYNVRPFFIGKYAVTQREWREIMEDNPGNFQGDDLPVGMENISWYEVAEYCNRRSEKEGLTPAYTISGTEISWNLEANNGYRTPTEAEWGFIQDRVRSWGNLRNWFCSLDPLFRDWFSPFPLPGRFDLDSQGFRPARNAE